MMVVDNIEESDELKEKLKSKERKGEEIKALRKYNQLRSEFNKEAEKINSPFRISFPEGEEYPDLVHIKKGWIFTDRTIHSVIFYYDKLGSKKDIYSFYDELDFKVFRAIEPILNKINCKVWIKLKNGKIPAKYKIVEAL